MSIDKLKGTWRADFDRYPQVNPDMAELGASMMDMMLGTLEIEVTDEKVAIKNYGGKENVQQGAYTATEQGDTLVLEATLEGSGRRGLFEVRFIDDDHIDFNLVEPKQDAMALQRA
jgi:hypothetical protein